jgi:hypothetical protein
MDRPQLVLGCVSRRWRLAHTKITGRQLQHGESAGSVDCHLGPVGENGEGENGEVAEEALVDHRHTAISWDMQRQCFTVLI